MLLPGKQKHSFLLTIIALFGLFLTETFDLLAPDAANNIGKYPDFTTDGVITRFKGHDEISVYIASEEEVFRAAEGREKR